MFRRIALVMTLAVVFAAWGASAWAEPIYVYAQLTGDPRAANPDNLFVNVTISWLDGASTADWTVDLSGMKGFHDSVKLDEFGFNLAAGSYSFSAFDPTGWAVTAGDALQGSGGMSFLFSALDPSGPPKADDVTIYRKLTFTMTKVGALSVSDFFGAPSTCSSDQVLGCAQLGAHLQSLTMGGGATTDSGVALGDYSQDLPPAIPEPASMILFGTGLIGAASIRRFRRK
jgi:hypothetical protein